MRSIKIIFILVFGLFTFYVSAQRQKSYSTSEIQLLLKKLNVLGSALYIAAHPDDENTRLITYLGKKENLEVAYLSLTRGDGGQNLVGTEKGPLMGLLRTQELLAARRIDGGKQFFTRANDFSYSKTYEETLNIWDEEKVLSDMVWVIRKFRPDVLITRFPPLKYGYPTHGHHTASAYLAGKAFDMAGDPEAFPEQLQFVDTWQPKRLYWNTSTWFYRRTDTELDTTGKLQLDVGAYIPLLGLSCTEIAADSRSQHKSQGFGAAKTRGAQIEWLEYVKGDSASNNLFEGIDLTWSRVGKPGVGKLLKKAYEQFDPKNPVKVLPDLLEAYKQLEKAEDHWSVVKRDELKTAIRAICGLYLEAIAENYSVTPGGSVKVTASALNRSKADIRLENVWYSFTQEDELSPAPLQFNQPKYFESSIEIPANYPLTQPYWLEEEPDNIGMYKVDRQDLIGLPESPNNLNAHFKLSVEGVDIQYDVPIQYNWTDRVKGELYRPLIVTPRLTINPQQKVITFSEEKPKEIIYTVRAWTDNINDTLKFVVPKRWEVTPESIPFKLEKYGQEYAVSVSVKPPRKAGRFELKPYVKDKEGMFNREFVEINHDHIPIRTVWPESKTTLIKLDLKKKGDKLGYIMGAGDEVADNLREIGYQVDMIDESNILQTDLSQYDAILVGIRAYNTEEWLPQQYDRLMEYVQQGGNLIVQYQTTRGLLTNDFGPYPFEIGHERVTVEGAAMNMINSKHPLFNEPNKIKEEDFRDWVQERGLYFAKEWDDHYQPVFSTNDPGEEPLLGSLIIANYGEGTFMYTGISFFRELPAGVPGAFRLLANMISYGK